MTGKILYLRPEEVKALLKMKETIAAVESAFREKARGTVQMPPKPYITFKEGDFRTMPAYLERTGLASVKIVNVHPKNPKRYGLPTVMALIEVLDPATGFPLSIMDGTEITKYRTGAASAVSIKYMARRDSRSVGIVGVGAQAPAHLLAAKEVLGDLERFYITDKNRAKAVALKRDFERELGIEILPKPSIRETVRDVDILITLTPSRAPIVMEDYLPPSVHICAVGSDAPGKEELDPKILKRPGVKIVLDDWEQGIHSGEVNVPISQGMLSAADIYGTLDEIVVGKKVGREGEETTIFDSTGLAIQDCVVASLVYKGALKMSVGTWLEFIPQSPK